MSQTIMISITPRSLNLLLFCILTERLGLEGWACGIRYGNSWSPLQLTTTYTVHDEQVRPHTGAYDCVMCALNTCALNLRSSILRCTPVDVVAMAVSDTAQAIDHRWTDVSLSINVPQRCSPGQCCVAMQLSRTMRVHVCTQRV